MIFCMLLKTNVYFIWSKVTMGHNLYSSPEKGGRLQRNDVQINLIDTLIGKLDAFFRGERCFQIEVTCHLNCV